MTKHKSESKTEVSVSSEQSEKELSPVGREGLISYFKNSWSEFKKVVWPTRSEAVKITLFVIIFVAILAAFIYAVDSIVSWLFFDVLLKKEG